MKKLISLLFFCLIASNLLAQGNILYNLRILDAKQKPVNNLIVNATETTYFYKVTGTTNEEGFVQLQLNNGIEWSLTIGEIEKDVNITAQPFQIIELGETFTYDVALITRKSTQDPTRTYSGYKTSEQTDVGGANQSTVTIVLSDPTQNLLANQIVKLVNVKGKIIYESSTNSEGQAQFNVPNNTNYEIDINENINFHFVDIGNESVNKTLNLQYAPTIVNETIKEDTIYQVNNSNHKPSIDRALIKIKIFLDEEKGKNESIYLKNIATNQTFAITADENGMVYALLPIQEIYLVDFEYEKNKDAINLMSSKQLTQGERTFYYNPDPRLQYPEKFIPTPDKLFIKSFGEFLDKQWEKPKDKSLLVQMFSGKSVNKSSQEALFKLTIAGSEEYGKSSRLPMNLVFVLDKSGSMYFDNRAELLKKALWDIGNILTDEDVVSIVLFNSEAKSVIQSTENHLETFESIIENYTPGGGTNIYEGLKIGSFEAFETYDQEKSNLLILLTDGYGITGPQEITDFVELQYQSGLQFSTIGLGEDFNQALLELIAEKGRGKFTFANDPEALSDVFLKEIKDAFSILAKDVSIQITFNDHLEFSQLMGYPISSQSNGSVTFNIPKVPKGMNELAFIKFKIKKPILNVEESPINLKVSYLDLSTQEVVSYEEDILLEWTPETDTEFLLDQHEKMLYAIAIMNQTLKLMAENHASDKDKEAKAAIKNGIDQVKEVYPDAKPKEVKVLFEDLEKYYMQFELIEKNKK